MSINQVQAPIGNRLFAPDQPLNVYVNSVLLDPSLYVVDYPNGIITFIPALTDGSVVTADFTTNQSIPADLQEAAILVTAHILGQALQNPIGVDSYSIQTYSVSFGQKSKVKERIDEILSSYKSNFPKFL